MSAAKQREKDIVLLRLHHNSKEVIIFCDPETQLRKLVLLSEQSERKGQQASESQFGKRNLGHEKKVTAGISCGVGLK